MLHGAGLLQAMTLEQQAHIKQASMFLSAHLNCYLTSLEGKAKTRKRKYR